jgi:hypothetical protein
VLVNGKRRHAVALVNLFGAPNRGSTGTDMNAIPLLATDNVQVLRDGAAALYGTAGMQNRRASSAACQDTTHLARRATSPACWAAASWPSAPHCGVSSTVSAPARRAATSTPTAWGRAATPVARGSPASSRPT